ncbi:MAG: DUF4105 domain-containing protein [Pseudomonadota bacterium]
MTRILALFVLVLSPCLTWASENIDQAIAPLLVQAREKQTARDPYWRALLHYRYALPGFEHGMNSEVVTPDFFLSPQGTHDPESELAATLKAFFQIPGEEQDEHAQCRFIARYKWLRKMLDWGEVKPPAVACRKFEDWSRHGHITSLSMVFATGYFSNPASFYGHILLKFNTGRAVAQTDLLNESVNFGAIVPEDENALRYVLFGIVGGYEAAFSSVGFYRLNHIYAEDELRDMWEYELALSPDEVDQIAAHSWELLRVRFAYYFVNENCAYRMSELLALVIKEPLLPASLPWSVPVDVFDRLVTIERNGKPLVRKVGLIPSRLNRFRMQYRTLSKGQQQVLVKLVENKLDFAQTGYAKLSEAEKVSVVDTLLDYYQFRIVGDRENAAHRFVRRELLVERAGLPATRELSSLNDATQNSDVRPPHVGPLPGMVRLGVLQNNKLGNGVALRVRPVYFDSLELDAGRIPHANLTIFDLNAVHASDRWQIRSLDLVNIEHLNVAETPLPGDGGWAWRIKFGFESEDLQCINCTTAHVTGGIGKALKVADSVTGYGMAEAFARTSHLYTGTVGANARIGLLATPCDSWKSSLMFSRRVYFNGAKSSVPLLGWESRFGTARDWDLRVSYNRHVASEWQVAISSYW